MVKEINRYRIFVASGASYQFFEVEADGYELMRNNLIRFYSTLEDNTVKTVSIFSSYTLISIETEK